MAKITLSGMNIQIAGQPWILERSFQAFLSDFQTPDIICDVIFTRAANRFDPKCKVFETEEQTIYLSDGVIAYAFTDQTYIPSYITATKDWSQCKIFISDIYDNQDDASCVSRVRAGVSYALKIIFVCALLWRRGLMIHAASIDWQGEGILFSAPSGTGKTTHVNLWKQKYGVPVLDGDTTACRIADGRPMVYGLPWCGTSGEFLNASLPLGALVFLEQDKTNTILRLSPAEAAARLYARSFLFTWDAEMADLALKTVTDIVSSARCYLLMCRPDFEAVELVKQCLEKE